MRRNDEEVPFYDINVIKEIPITKVCDMLGIEIERKQGGAWCKLRNETTASCKLYLHTNTFTDFGANVGGDVIALVAYVQGTTQAAAIEALGTLFHLQPLNKKAVRHYDLSAKQYEKIGIEYELATMNFTFNIDKYGLEKTKAFSEKYRMSVGELKKQYPNVYANMIKAKAIPFVYQQRQEYYQLLWNTDNLYQASGVNICSSPNYTGELREHAQRINNASQILQQAIKDTALKVQQITCEAITDIQNIRAGKLTFEVGNIPYFELKKAAHQDDLCYRILKITEYNKISELLQNVNVAAFVKADTINLAYRSSDKEQLEKLLSEKSMIQNQVKHL